MRPMPGLTNDEHRCVIHEGPLRLVEKAGKVKPSGVVIIIIIIIVVVVVVVAVIITIVTVFGDIVLLRTWDLRLLT